MLDNLELNCNGFTLNCQQDYLAKIDLSRF